jgi:hypothetical protein
LCRACRERISLSLLRCESAGRSCGRHTVVAAWSKCERDAQNWGREGSAPEPSLDLHPSEVSTSLSPWLHPSTLARMHNLYRLQWRTHCNDRCGDSFHADGSAFPELFSWANLSTSTRISSLTLYTVNKAVNTTERTENFTCCGNRDFQDTTLMSRD